MHHHFQIARLEFFHAAAEYDAAAIDEHDIRENVMDLFHLMCRHDNGAAAIEVVVQQGIVELLKIEDVKAKRRVRIFAVKIEPVPSDPASSSPQKVFIVIRIMSHLGKGRGP